MRPPANNALARLGTLSVTLNDELRPGWLVADGTTEYARAAYPAFVTKFSAKRGSSPERQRRRSSCWICAIWSW